jgi:hypothetical protein
MFKALVVAFISLAVSTGAFGQQQLSTVKAENCPKPSCFEASACYGNGAIFCKNRQQCNNGSWEPVSSTMAPVCNANLSIQIIKATAIAGDASDLQTGVAPILERICNGKMSCTWQIKSAQGARLDPWPDPIQGHHVKVELAYTCANPSFQTGRVTKSFANDMQPMDISCVPE